MLFAPGLVLVVALLAGAELPEWGGERMRFVSPREGEAVVAGDSLTIELAVDDGVSMESPLLVSVPGGMVILEPPYRTKFRIDPALIGPLEFTALGKTTTGELVEAPAVTVLVGPGEAELVELSLFNDPRYIDGPGCLASLTIYGMYTDGVERELTDFRTTFTAAEGGDRVCVFDDGVVVGRAPGPAVILVTHGGRELRVALTVGDGDCGNNPPHANLPEDLAGRAGQKLCLDASGVIDRDSCLGESLETAQYRWTVHLGSEVHEGTGAVFCFTPASSGTGIASLKVTDRHGASSETVATVRIE